MQKHKEPLDIAFSQLGVKEDPIGSNWGKQVSAYLKGVGVNFAAPWCAAFVYWCFNEAYGDKNPLCRTGGVLKMWNDTPHKYRSKEPAKGDIFIFDYGSGKGHTGIIYDVDGMTLHTIEGNTNSTGSREGYEVATKKRMSIDKKLRGYLRITPME